MSGFKRAVPIFALCMAAAMVCAFAFEVMLQVSLPRTDWAYGQSPLQSLSDPFAFYGTIDGAVI
jgi:hypothetical protein